MLTLVILGGYGLLAYLVLPGFWTHYEHQRGLADMPMVTRTAQGIPGDPLNVGLIGDIGDVVCAMHAAGWYPADLITDARDPSGSYCPPGLLDEYGQGRLQAADLSAPRALGYERVDGRPGTPGISHGTTKPARSPARLHRRRQSG